MTPDVRVKAIDMAPAAVGHIPLPAWQFADAVQTPSISISSARFNASR